MHAGKWIAVQGRNGATPSVINMAPLYGFSMNALPNSKASIFGGMGIHQGDGATKLSCKSDVYILAYDSTDNSLVSRINNNNIFSANVLYHMAVDSCCGFSIS